MNEIKSIYILFVAFLLGLVSDWHITKVNTYPFSRSKAGVGNLSETLCVCVCVCVCACAQREGDNFIQWS